MKERRGMLRKLASVVEGEYTEWEQNEGPVHPNTQREKSLEFQSELLPVQMGRTDSKYNLSLIKSRGLRVA